MKRLLMIIVFTTAVIVFLVSAVVAETTGAREDISYDQDYEELRRLAEDSGFYPKLARVIGFENGTIIIEDSQGFTWGFSEEDYDMSVHIGDFVALLMHDNGTSDNIFDDIVIRPAD